MVGRKALWLAITGVLSAHASAQGTAPTGVPSEDSTIVVTSKTAPPPTASEVYEQSLEVSRLDPRQLYDLPSPRFVAPVCPGVFGLTDEAAAVIVDRIRANAQRLGIKLAKGQCTPNLVVGIFDDSRALLSDLERNQPRLFRLVEPSERQELLANDFPVRVWNNIRTIGPYGPVPIRRGKEQVPNFRNVAMYLPMRREVLSALVVFEREAVIGKTFVQLADYATMRGLSHSRPASGEERMPTILALFSCDEGPDELTSFDVGYLGSLYFDRPESRAVSRLLGVRKRAAREATRAQD